MNDFYKIFLSLLLLTFSAFSQNGDGDNKVVLEAPVEVKASSPNNTEAIIPEVEKIVTSADIDAARLKYDGAIQGEGVPQEPEKLAQKEEAFAHETSKSLAIYFALLMALLVGVMLLAWFIPAKSTNAED